MVGALIVALTRKHKRELRSRDGFLLVTFAWILMSAIATIPLLLALPGLSFTDAFFETMDGRGQCSFREFESDCVWERRKLYAVARADQAKRRTKGDAQRRLNGFPNACPRNKFLLAIHPQEMHEPSTVLPQLVWVYI